MRAYLANKIFSALSGILSLITLGTSGWILSSLLIKKYGYQCDLRATPSENGSSCPMNSTDKTDFHDAVVIEASTLTPGLTDFYIMKSSFQTIIIICLSCVMAASVVQLISSSIILLSASYKIATRSRKIVAVLFGVLIVFLICFSWPLAYKRDYDDDEDSLHTVSTLNSAVHEFFQNFDYHNLLKDLTLYYIETLANIIFLFAYMVVTCCLLRCNDNHEYII